MKNKMAKKYLFFMLSVVVLMFSISLYVYAETNCDSQAKPALSCPEGYSMMCIPVGGDHWGCGKESNGLIIEVSGSGAIKAGTDGAGSSVQTQTRTVQLIQSEENMPP